MVFERGAPPIKKRRIKIGMTEPIEMKQTDAAETSYRQERIAHWDAVARWLGTRDNYGHYYHKRLEWVFQFLVPAGKKIIEIGCGRGDLLAALKPSVGIGIDFSSEMIQQAKSRHPDLHFIQADAHEFEFEETFDVIILSDLVGDLWDVQMVFRQVARLSNPKTRIIMNFYSRLWQLPLGIARKLRLAMPLLFQNWLTVEDITGLLWLEGFEVVRHWEEMLLPLQIPILSTLANRFLVKIWPFQAAALTHMLVARPLRLRETAAGKPSVSVVVPARNEAGNIPDIFARTPEMGSKTELVFVEGHSKDNTYEAIERAIVAHPNRPCKLLRQTGEGKGDAVRLGFTHASGDILMILDSDLAVPPEDLARFYEVLCEGKGDFVNGVRLVYPMEKQAMRFLNLLGNKFFSLAFWWLLGQPVKDSLCGTKVLWKGDYQLIEANRTYFGDFDPFGDFDLLFGAAKLNLKIVDLPIRYRERVYGTTNINRWKHGWLLLKMVVFAMRKIKFI